MRKKNSCIVVGAGPAGLSAAIAAARSGWSVLVLEKNAQPGRKLLITAGGRANLYDPDVPELDALEAYGRSGRFLRQVLAAFSWAEFLKKLNVEIEREADANGVETVYVRGGARRFLDALLTEARRLGVELVTGAAVSSASVLLDGNFEVRSQHLKRKCNRLILATGGMTYPSTGSSGDGYGLAGLFGHKVESPRAALDALTTTPSFPNLAGISVVDSSVTLRRDRRKLASRRGALLFTHHGVSGPTVLDLSLELSRASASPQDFPGAQLVADLRPDVTGEQLVQEFLTISKSKPRRSLANAGVSPALSARLVRELAHSAHIDPAKRMGQVSRAELTTLAANIKALTLTVREPLDPRRAMITVGGVMTEGLDPHTMESRRVPGLCFVGELLAPAGPCGGHNLLMAFATGQAAGSRPPDSPS